MADEPAVPAPRASDAHDAMEGQLTPSCKHLSESGVSIRDGTTERLWAQKLVLITHRALADQQHRLRIWFNLSVVRLTQRRALRRAIGAPDLPVVVGELGYWLDQADPCYTHAAAINSAIVATPAAMEHAACVSAHGLSHKGDRLHFDAPAAEALGIRYAEAWLQMREPHGDDRREAGATSFDFGSSTSSSFTATRGAVKRPKVTRQDEALASEIHGGGARPFSFPDTPQGAAEESRGRPTTEAAVRD